MPSSAVIGGAIGLLLPEFPKIAAIYGDLKLIVNKALEGGSVEDPGKMESAPEVLEVRDRLRGICGGRDHRTGISHFALDRLRG